MSSSEFVSASRLRFALPVFVCLLLALLVQVGCVPAPTAGVSPVDEAQPVAGGPPAFQLRTLERTAGECAETSGSCARFLARYPVITGGVRRPVQEAVNNALVRTVARGVVIDGDEGEAPFAVPETLEAAADEFLASWREARAELPAEAMGPGQWSDERRMHVIYADHRVLSVELATFSYTAGAHPNTFIHLESYDLATGNPLALADLVAAGAEPRLEELGEKAFRRQRQVPETASLEAAGFWFEDDRFRLNDNFAVTGAGLTFLFNPYEVAPYVFGPTRITVLWSELGDLLRPDAPITPAAAAAAPPPQA